MTANAAIVPITAILNAAIVALDGTTIPVNTAIRYAILGGLALIRAQDGRGAKIPAEMIGQVARLDTGSLLDELAEAPLAPSRVNASDRGDTRFERRPAVALDDEKPRPVAPVTTRPGHTGDDRPMTQRDFHGIDSFVTEGKAADCRTVDDLCRVARLDWTVKPQSFVTDSGAKGGDLRAIVRSDTNTVLSVMSKGYNTLSPAESFAPLGALVDAGATFRGAGSFRGGRTIWAQVDLGTHEVAKGDAVKMFAHVRDTYDGATVWSLQVGSIRIVCANTLMHACDAGEFLGRARHDRALRATVEDAEKALAAMRGEAHRRVEEYRALTRWSLTAEERRAFVSELIGDEPAKTAKRERETWHREQAEIDALFRGVRFYGAEHTDLTSAWAALNVATQWADHNLAKNRTPDPVAQQRRIHEAGVVSDVKASAYEWLMEHVPAAAARA